MPLFEQLFGYPTANAAVTTGEEHAHDDYSCRSAFPSRDWHCVGLESPTYCEDSLGGIFADGVSGAGVSSAGADTSEPPSTSSLATLANEAILSPSLRFMMRTPCVLRPITRISDTCVRLTMPCVVISTTSSASRPLAIRIPGPFPSEVGISRRPLPPRRCRR